MVRVSGRNSGSYLGRHDLHPRTPAQQTKVGRNERCSCGSGRKIEAVLRMTAVYCPCTVELPLLRIQRIILNEQSISYVFSIRWGVSSPTAATSHYDQLGSRLQQRQFLAVAPFGSIHARFLAPLVKARVFE